jgi:hypothetical protein
MAKEGEGEGEEKEKEARVGQIEVTCPGLRKSMPLAVLNPVVWRLSTAATTLQEACELIDWYPRPLGD